MRVNPISRTISCNSLQIQVYQVRKHHCSCPKHLGVKGKDDKHQCNGTHRNQKSAHPLPIRCQGSAHTYKDEQNSHKIKWDYSRSFTLQKGDHFILSWAKKLFTPSQQNTSKVPCGSKLATWHWPCFPPLMELSVKALWKIPVSPDKLQQDPVWHPSPDWFHLTIWTLKGMGCWN